MTTCQDWLTDLTHTADQILNEDLAALKRMGESARIERYEQLQADEQELRWEFTKECDGFLTGAEEDRLRGELRLARLLVAASFYADGDVPEPIDGDFIDAELQAVVEFDRFKQFDALDDDQIEERIRRMDGEVAALIEEYASTQIANIDDLLDNPDVQQDVVERLLERYENRRERIRQGVFHYAETHGLDGVAAGFEGDAGDLVGDVGNAGDGANPSGQHGSQPARGTPAQRGGAIPNHPGEERDGTDVVTAATARLFELDYLGRFETTMYETDQIALPDETFSVPSDYWDGRHGRRDKADRMETLLDDHAGGDLDAHPINPTARYEITAPKYFGLTTQTRMVIEATVYSHLETHAKHGYDATPAGVDDLVSTVGNSVREASDGGTPYLLGIASPTGWTEDVIDHVENDDLSRTRYGRQVSVCLIDLRRGELIYDDADPVVDDNTDLFKRAVHAEAVADCISLLREEYLNALGRDSVLLTAIVDDTEFDRHVVKQAFARIEADGGADQFYLDEHGLALDFA
ncbi:hypothetical protein EGH24_10625 [Halonotius terrestris]|uniref:Uncharacterized protein n=1 Tax=Halonotius terrestris TaxID=2487750 RepID=A0A8J8P6S4_9EURY|nr:hypothetical protein [Halonotius terrestris]TQQ79928.1 hypothetical protein EGH24_10625 [Halonotius terrestris]